MDSQPASKANRRTRFCPGGGPTRRGIGFGRSLARGSIERVGSCAAPAVATLTGAPAGWLSTPPARRLPRTLSNPRDIRDPKLVQMGGRLFLYAISRVPGFHYRDLGGQAWTVRAESADGRFTADFGTQPVPPEAYPLLNDPFLTVNEFVLSGATTSSDGFCGSVTGYAQVFGAEPSDRIRLEGSTVGALRITGDVLPAPVTACPRP
jgi:hypothetical protein